MKKAPIAMLALASLSLVLSGCSGAGSEATDSAANPGEKGFDVSKVKADSAVEALVPDQLKKQGVLKNGAATDYAPAEFKKADGTTPTGYDVDMVKALALKMGLKEGTTTHSEFDSLIPKIGNQFDIGASSFTITKERMAGYNMVSYARVGFQYGVAKGNPNKFDPQNVCGKTIGVQTGTAQEEAIAEISKKCQAESKPAVKVQTLKSQAEVTQKVVGGQYDATLADSPVIGYAIKMSNGQLEKAGESFDTALHGIVVAKNNEPLAKAIQAALDSLIKDGTLKQIFDTYGAGDLLLDKAEINPSVD